MTPSLVGLAEVAEILGVNRQRAHQIAYTKGFPDPVARLAMGPVWLREDVEQWRSVHRARSAG